MKRPLALPTSLLGLGCILAASGAAAALVVALPVEPPAVLASTMAAPTARVAHRTDADERQLQLALETGAPRALTTTREGTVTDLRCSAGAVVQSGDVVATVDGAPVIAFASTTPLWRDLEPGDHGDDVRGLQTELARLGIPILADGIAGTRTLSAARTFLIRAGVSSAELGDDGVPVRAFAWIAAPETTVRTCEAVVGAAVPAEGGLMSLPAELRGARLEQVPTDATAGARTVTSGSLSVSVTTEGVVADGGDLAAIAALPEYQATVASADGGVPSLAVTWALAAPLPVDVVPPTALWDLDERTACVQPATGGPLLVDVVGSELGQAFLQHDGDPIDRVRTAPDTSRSCR